MAMFTLDAAKDAKLQFLKDNFDKLVACVGEPTTYANANTNYLSGGGQKCAEVAIASGDLTISDGPVDGRQITVAEQTGVTPVVNGTVDHYVWLDTNNSRILHYAPISPSKAITTGGNVIFPAHSYVDRDTTPV